MTANNTLNLAAIEFTGDWFELLNGQLTVKPEIEAARYSAILNTKGKVVVSCWIWGFDKEKAWLVVPTDMLDEVFMRFAPLAQLAKVKTEKINQQFFPALSKEIDNGINLPFGSIALHDQGDSVNEWHLARMKAVYPIVSQQFNRQSFAHYLNLPSLGAVDFDKGCYVGQEIVSRMHFKTTIKKHTYYFEGYVPDGAEVIESTDEHSLAIVADAAGLVLPYSLVE